MALEMQRIAQNIYYGPETNRKQFKLKIGIHRGSVIAGVIGFHKPQFSLIGDTVNTTSRICGGCQEEEISISESVFNEVSKYRWYFVKYFISPKGLDKMPVWKIYENYPKINEKVRYRWLWVIEQFRLLKLIGSQPKCLDRVLQKYSSENRRERLQRILNEALTILNPKTELINR